MNSRNAHYILSCNPREFFPLVDDKVITKKLAKQHTIPTPELYHVITNHSDIRLVDAVLDPYHEFVVKPARGSGGSGIMLVSEKTSEGYVTQSGKSITRESFIHHIHDILSGIFSLEGLEDSAIIEALIHPDQVFSAVTFQGVPDIRVVVYRGVPAMAMARLPTRASDGKANLHRGAIGAGIDISTGLTMTAVHNFRIVTNHPDTRNLVTGITVPFWDKILHMSSLASDMTNLNYIGADFVLDRARGPVLLELNARPGLAIQMANRSGLKKRLDQIDTALPSLLETIDDRIRWARENLAAKSEISDEDG
jgi:alpha-L-glutamate ligase-like protein